MGKFFKNIHIKKDNKIDINSLKESFVSLMISNGYKVEDKKDIADGKITIFSSSDSKWITVFSDLFEINNSKDFRNIYDSLGIKNDFLGIYCYDSDYVGLNLINDNDGVDAWVNIGMSCEIKSIRKSNFKDWKYRISNLEKFKELSKKEYTFAEDFLDYSGEFFELPLKQAVMQGGVDIFEDDDKIYEIYFSIANNSIKKELPKLEIVLPTLVPCIPGETQVISAYNNGGESRGLSVLLFGDFVEKEEITFTETYLQYKIKKQYKLIPIKFEKVKINNDLWVYMWKDENFYIPPKVKEELPLMKKEKLVFERTFSIRFVPNGNNRKFLDIKVCFIPIKNSKEGQCTWYVWKRFSSKREFLEEENQHRLSDPFFGAGIFPEDRGGIYNLEDYDLD